MAGHPVIEALAPAVERGDLPKSSLLNMIEARRFDLYDDPMPALNDLEGYLGDTAAAVIQMSALVLDREKAQACAEAAGLAGVAMGIDGLLRLMPLHRARGQCSGGGAGRQAHAAGESRSRPGHRRRPESLRSGRHHSGGLGGGWLEKDCVGHSLRPGMRMGGS